MIRKLRTFVMALGTARTMKEKKKDFDDYLAGTGMVRVGEFTHIPGRGPDYGTLKVRAVYVGRRKVRDPNVARMFHNMNPEPSIGKVKWE